MTIGTTFSGNYHLSPDTITFNTGAPQAAQSVAFPNGLMSDDVITFGDTIISSSVAGVDYHSTRYENDSFATPSNRQKYSEDVIIKELKDYITRTYDQHYSAGDDKIQTLDLIEACGDGEAFCRSNILKYASRYDKKGTARRDIMKILHYAVLLMHFNDKNAKRETYPQ
jgi:hypothetical protein